VSVLDILGVNTDPFVYVVGDDFRVVMLRSSTTEHKNYVKTLLLMGLVLLPDSRTSQADEPDP